MPFQRPSTLARSGAPDSALESQTYWTNDVIASGGEQWARSPTCGERGERHGDEQRVDRVIEQAAERR